MRKLFTTLLALGCLFTLQAKTYTLAELAEITPLQNNVGDVQEQIGLLKIADKTYQLVLPTVLAEGVGGISYDEANIIITKNDLQLADGNSLTINEGETLEFAGKARISMNGLLTANGAHFRAAEDATATAVGLRFVNDQSQVVLKDCTFDYVGVTFGNGGEDGLVDIDGCTFNDHNGKSGSGAINITSKTKTCSVKNSSFNDCSLAAVNSGLGVAMGLIFTDNQINKGITSTRLYPGLNIAFAGDYDMIVERNTITGPFETTLAGGIGFSNLLGATYTGTIYVRNNKITGHSYGITLTGPGNIVVEDNEIVDNKYIANATQGGSGINFTCSSSTMIAKAFVKGNIIKDNLWGITSIGNVDMNAGKVEDPNADDYNPGGNTFINNGNDGVLYDLYNNTANDAWAQGNLWNVEVQDIESIETVIVHKVDDESLGMVYFWPAAVVDGVESVKVDNAGDNRYYNLLGQPVANPEGGIYIHNGKKVIVK